MGKHKKRSRRKFFPVVDTRIAERSVDPMTETVNDPVVSPGEIETIGEQVVATGVYDLEYDEKDLVIPPAAAKKQQISQHTRSEEKARKNGRKPSRAKQMSKVYTGTRGANPIPRLR